jgi:hypothetical protein
MKSNRKVEDRRKWLQWVLDFIQTDLQSLSRKQPDKFIKLIEELVFFTSTEFPGRSAIDKDFDYYEDHYFPPPEKRKEELKDRFALAESQMVKIQEDLRSMLEDLQNIISIESQDGSKDYELCQSLAILSMGSYFTGDEDKFQVRYKPKDDNDLVAWAKVHFAELLGGLPVHAITKCRGCNTYFLNLTEKKKIYCTSSCASRSIQKEKRKKLKEDSPDEYSAYLKRQNRLSKESYRKKIQAKLGRKVKVGRKERAK